MDLPFAACRRLLFAAALVAAVPAASGHLVCMENPAERRGAGETDPPLRGPRARSAAFLRSRLAGLRDEAEPPPGAGGLAPDHWTRLMKEYRERQRAARERLGISLAPLAPANYWIPIGPSVVRKGEAANRPAVSGRVKGLAVTRLTTGATRVYAAAANGGVWRSDDGGATWTDTTESFDLNPTLNAVDSLACGAIAVSPTHPERVYLGTGEALPWASTNYYGVGPYRSDDAGANWKKEDSTPDLAGHGFYALAVDPADQEVAFGATDIGVYVRLPAGSAHAWVRKRSGAHTSLVVARGASGPTVAYAAEHKGNVHRSEDGGSTWTPLASAFPSPDVGRIGLAVRPQDPSVVYALAEWEHATDLNHADNGKFGGLWRWDESPGKWTEVSVSSDVKALFAKTNGWWDLAIAVDPDEPARIYLGGSKRRIGNLFAGALYRGDVTNAGTPAAPAYALASSYIGAQVHADIHAIAFTPTDPKQVWIGCDGGVFWSADARTTDDFRAKNVGLQTLSMEHLGVHPSEDAVLFSGTQDNGTVRYTGEEAWLHSAGADGGRVVVNWSDPYKVLRTVSMGWIERTTDGGQAYGSWKEVSLRPSQKGRCTFYAPLEGIPHVPGSSPPPGAADLVAFGGLRVWVSEDFATPIPGTTTGSWKSLPNDAPDATFSPDDLDSEAYAIAIASPTLLFAGTYRGFVHRFERASSGWSRSFVSPPGPPRQLPDRTHAAPVTDIAVAGPASLYVTLGGSGAYERVWHWDGTDWSAVSGLATPGGDSLLRVQHNAIVLDRLNPGHIYVGADIGVWRSKDSGATWEYFSLGLPDAAVIDLRIHPAERLLWASLHGRSVWEYDLSRATSPPVELYVRDTQLDRGRYPTRNGLPDPTRPGRLVRHWAGPDIKVDVPSANGKYDTLTDQIDFHEFVETIVDGAGGVATMDPSSGVLRHRVYVEVHNRGVKPAASVRVMLLLANASAGLPSLPAGYDANVRAGTPIASPSWRTLGMRTLTDVRVGFPKIASFELRSSDLPAPATLAGNAHHCLLALLHSDPDDPFTGTSTHPDLLSPKDRKAAHKNLHVIAFAGTALLGPPTRPLRRWEWAAIRIEGDAEGDAERDVELRARGYPGKVLVVLPRGLLENIDPTAALAGFERAPAATFREYAAEKLPELARWEKDQRFDPESCRRLRADIEACREQPGFVVPQDRDAAIVSGLRISRRSSYSLFLGFERPQAASLGDVFEVEAIESDKSGRKWQGGSLYRIEVVMEGDASEGVTPRISASRAPSGDEIVRVQILGAGGEPLGPAEGGKAALYFHSGSGLHREIHPMAYDGGRRAFELVVTDLPHREAGEVKVTAVGEAQAGSFRATRTLRF